MVRPIDVRILCRNAIVREGLGRILADNHFSVSQHSTISEILHEVPSSMRSDDVRLNLIDIIFLEHDPDLVARLKESDPAAYTVILADAFDLEMMMDGFEQGAASYILKEISSERLIGTLRLVAVGEPVLPPQLIEALQVRPQPSNIGEKPIDAACLSDREFQILRWLIVGHPNKIISQRMDISEATVKVHVKSVLRKLNVQNRTQAAIWAANHGVQQNDMRSERCASRRTGDAPQLPMFRMPGR